MTTIHLQPDAARTSMQSLKQSHGLMLANIQALSDGIRRLDSAWEGGSKDIYITQIETVHRALLRSQEEITFLTERLDREITEWEAIDQRGASTFKNTISSGANQFVAMGGLAMAPAFASIAALLAGLPIWLSSFLDRVFPSTSMVSPLVKDQANITVVNQSTESAQQKSKFGELIEKADKEAKKKEEKPKYISQYSARDDDGTYLAGQEKGDSCALASTKMALYRAADIDAKEADLRTASSKLDGGYHDDKKWGTTPSSLDDLVNKEYGDKVVATYNNPATQSIDDLKKAAENDQGIVVSVKNSEWFGGSAAHSVTVIGVTSKDDKQVIQVNDPWPPGAGKRLEIPADDFERAWYGDAMYVSKKPQE